MKAFLGLFLSSVFFVSAAQARDDSYNCQYKERFGSTPLVDEIAKRTHPRWEFGFALVLNEGEVLKLRKLEIHSADTHEAYYDGVGSRALNLPGSSKACEIYDFISRKTFKIPTRPTESCFTDLQFTDSNGKELGWVLIVPANVLGSDKPDFTEVRVMNPMLTGDTKDGLESEIYTCRLIQ